MSGWANGLPEIMASWMFIGMHTSSLNCCERT
jgi:hypothetical protein